MRGYDKDFKDEAIKLSYKIGTKEAADKLGISVKLSLHGEVELNSMEKSLLWGVDIDVLIL